MGGGVAFSAGPDRGDTIAALSSPPGAGGRGIVRLSGPRAFDIARSLCDPPPDAPKGGSWNVRDVRLRISGRTATLPGALYRMPSPRSYTREDVAELHVPGSPPVLSGLLEACFRAGARPAGPGEFTLRAYLNGRLDLSRAEAVNRLIRARDDAGRRAALLDLDGRLERETARVSRLLARALACIEARLDFSDQDLDDAPAGEVRALLDEAAAALALLAGPEGERAERTRPLVVLAGRANAGKSSLFNALAGRALSIVTDHAGTTRDVVTAELGFLGASFVLADPAGLGGEESAPARKARDAFRRWADAADLVVAVYDASRLPGAEEDELARLLDGRPVLSVLNKCDLACPWPPGLLSALGKTFPASAVTGAGLAELREALAEALRSGAAPRAGESFGLGARQRAAAGASLRCVERAAEALDAGRDEIAAVEARDAAEGLGVLAGRDLTEEILGEVFARFCVGK